MKRCFLNCLLGSMLSLTVFVAGITSQALAQSKYVDPRSNYSGYLEWCRSIDGIPYNVGTTQVGCRPRTGGNTPGAGISTGDPLYQLGYQLGTAIGKALFGDPQERARRQAELEEAQRQIRIDQERIAAEQARIAEERYQRIMALVKGVDSAGSLSLNSLKGGSSTEPLRLKTGTAFFGTPSNPSGDSIDLGHKLELKGIGESDGTVLNSPLAQLNSAAFLSQQAAKVGKDAVKVGKDEDAKFLADAAFEVVIGGTLNLAIPPEVKGVPVAQAKLDAFSNVRKEFLAARENLERANREVADTENKKWLADELRKEAKKKLEEAKFQKDKLQTAQPDENKAEDDKLAEAQKLLEEATKLDEKVTKDLEEAKNEAAKAENDLKVVEQKTREYVKGLGGGDVANKAQ